MCLYHFNNKGNNEVKNEEFEVLKNIYACIDANDTSGVKTFTKKLIGMQSSDEKIGILNEAINNLN